MSDTFWTALGAVAAVVGVILAAVAAYYAKAYAKVAARIFKLEQTPAVRMTRRGDGDAGLILKNIGRGAAISIVLTDSQHQILQLRDSKGGFRDSVDVLDPHAGEALGRYETVCQSPIPRANNQVYCLYYQDFIGGWHLTKEYVQGEDFRCEFLGPQTVGSIPAHIRDRAQVGGQ